MQDAITGVGSKGKLLLGALDCIEQRGYARTSSRDIARAAGVNVASINYHFGSKDALLDEALGRCFETWNQRVEAAFEDSAASGVLEQLGAVLHTAIDSFGELESSLHACVESFPQALRSPQLRARLAAGYADIRETGVRRSREALSRNGIEPPGNLHAMASVIIAICDGLMLQWIADPEATPDAAQALAALATLAVIAASPGSHG